MSGTQLPRPLGLPLFFFFFSCQDTCSLCFPLPVNLKPPCRVLLGTGPLTVLSLWT